MKTYLMMCIILMMLLSCAKSPSNTIVVGMELAYPPFEMTDEQGKPTGVSVDLAKAIGEKIGTKIQIENMAFDGLIPALKTSKIDFILSSMTATEERAKSIAFSDPYLKTGLCLLVNVRSKVQGIQDLNFADKKVVVKKGTTGHIYATEFLKNAQILVVDKESSAVMEVVQNTADAFIYDQMSTFKNWQANSAETRAILKPFKEENWAIGLRQEDKDLQEKINKALTELKAEGFFEQLGEKYLSEQKAAFKELGYPFYF